MVSNVLNPPTHIYIYIYDKSNLVVVLNWVKNITTIFFSWKFRFFSLLLSEDERCSDAVWNSGWVTEKNKRIKELKKKHERIRTNV